MAVLGAGDKKLVPPRCTPNLPSLTVMSREDPPLRRGARARRDLQRSVRSLWSRMCARAGYGKPKGSWKEL